MRLEPTEDQRQLVDHFDKLFARQWTEDDWPLLLDAGLPLMRVDEGLGGSGLGLQEAVLIFERAGWHEVPARLTATVAAAFLLARIGDSKGLAQVADGASVMFGMGSVSFPQGFVGMSIALLDDQLKISAIGQDGAESLSHSIVGGSVLRAAFVAAQIEQQILTTAYLCGLSQRALADAAAYSCERMAFGRPIGAYQGVAHPLANAVVDMDGAWLLLLYAIAALAKNDPNTFALIEAAHWWARSRSGPALLHALRVFGGHGVAIGQASARRFALGRTLALHECPPDVALDRYSASSEAGGGETELPKGVGEPFDFGDGPSAAADKARAFFAKHLTPELSAFAELSEDGHDLEIQQAMAANGLLFPHWNGHTDSYAMAEIRLASARAGWNLTAIVVTELVGAILARFGSDTVRAAIIPRLADGTVNCALGYTEPAGGSDVFAVETRAVRDGDDWVIDGQKIFTSQGHLADYVLLVTRTNREATKHRGITLFLVPTDSPGYSFAGMQTLGGERTNTTFYDGVRVPDDYRVGPVDGGASVLIAALELEQNCGQHFLPPIERMTAAARDWQAQNCPDDRLAGRVIASAEIRGLVLDLLARRALWSQTERKKIPAAGPAAKLFGSEAWMQIGQELLALAAPASLHCQQGGLGIIEREARRAIASTIYGGTSEIQRSLIAEGRLSMPRSRV